MGDGISIKCSNKKCTYTNDLQEGWGFLSCNVEIALRCFKGENKVSLKKHLSEDFLLDHTEHKLFYCNNCKELTSYLTFTLTNGITKIRSKHICKKCGKKLYKAKYRYISKYNTTDTSPLVVEYNKQTIQYHCPKCGADKFKINFFLWD